MRTATRKCRHGTLTFPAADRWIGGALEQTGEYSEPEVQKLLSLIDGDSVVVEVGANVGTITVPLAKRAAVVYAFEPQPAIFGLLRQNVAQNGLTARVERLALGATRGTVSIERLDLDVPGVNSGAARIVDGGGGDAVDMTTLDEYCDANGVDPDLIKIDVEGHEAEVLRGAREIIARCDPILYVENDRREKSRELIDLITGMGYRCYWHLPALHNPDPLGEQSLVSINMLCVPPGCLVDVSDCDQILSPDADPMLVYERRTMAKRPAAPAVGGERWACVVRLGGVGDNLIASSVLPALRERWGRVEVIAQHPQHVVFENNPHVDKLTVKHAGEPPYGDGYSWQRYWADRASEYAFFAHLSHSVETLGALTAQQTAFYWPASARRRLCGRSYLEIAADVCEVPYDRLAPNFFPTEAEDDAAAESKRLLGGRYVGWVISGTRVDKLWPTISITVARIIRELGVPVVVFGMPGRDFEVARSIQENVRVANGSDAGFHLALSRDPEHPHWPVRRLLTQVQHADVVVTPDTGPAWAVAMRPVPKVVLLSHASPENITKYWVNATTLHADRNRVPCWPCHLLIDAMEQCERLSGRRGEQWSACISDIGVEQVLGAVRTALGSGSATRQQQAAE